jgi:hypothetical protein
MRVGHVRFGLHRCGFRDVLSFTLATAMVRGVRGRRLVSAQIAYRASVARPSVRLSWLPDAGRDRCGR